MREHPGGLDPVMVAKGGHALLARPKPSPSCANACCRMATVITPNLPEAEALTDLAITTEPDMHAAATPCWPSAPPQPC